MDTDMEMENYNSNVTVDYNTGSSSVNGYIYIDIPHQHMDAYRSECDQVEPANYDSCMGSMEESDLYGFAREEVPSVFVDRGVTVQGGDTMLSGHYQNPTDSHVPKYESEYQSKWLLEMMTDPKVETLKHEIEARGGSMGFFNVSLVWDNTDDLDLSVKCPCCPKIYYGGRNSKCGGKLDMDANNGGVKITQVPIENIFWDDVPPSGKYTITISNYNGRNGSKTPFRCLVRYKDVIKAFDGKVGHKEDVVVFDDMIVF